MRFCHVYLVLRVALLCLLCWLPLRAQQHGLQFNGSLTQHVNHGLFWEIYTPTRPNNVLSDDFAWEAWVKVAPANGLGYVISAGYGGAHSILLGFDVSAERRKASVVGNFAVLPDGKCMAGDAFHRVDFRTDAAFDLNTWYHVAVASRNHILTVYKDGEPILSQTWTGKRISNLCYKPDGAEAILYIGGSTHLNFTGEIAQVRGWEGFTPYGGSRFVPETTFSASWREKGSDPRITDAVFLTDYRNKKRKFDDLSKGYKGRRHSGIPNF